jgi:hypothetical protein
MPVYLTYFRVLTDYIKRHVRIQDLTGYNLKGNIRDLQQLTKISRVLPGGNEEYHEQGSRYS